MKKPTYEERVAKAIKDMDDEYGDLPEDLAPANALDFPHRRPSAKQRDKRTTPQIAPEAMIEALNEAARTVGKYMHPGLDREGNDCRPVPDYVLFKLEHVKEDEVCRNCLQYEALCNSEKLAVMRCIRKAAAKFGLPCDGKEFGIKVEHERSCGCDVYWMAWTFQSWD